MNEAQDQFLKIYQNFVVRPGAGDLLEWLESTDFFTAPASTRFHLSRPGGLVEHSVHVYDRLGMLCESEAEINRNFTQPSMETIAIVGLLHDICKANFYAVEIRNRKNALGQWEQYPFYIVNDQLPYGHGEKSVYILSAFLKLTRAETMAIRWHMGPWQDGEKRIAGQAFEKYPLAVLTHLADMQATYLDETEQCIPQKSDRKEPRYNGSQA